jgi:hypothetical protein
MRSGHFGVGIGLAIVVTLCGACFAPVLAQRPTPEQAAAIRQSCRSDFMSHCAGVQPGGREALQCLKSNVGSVSAPCKAALDALSAKPAAESAPPPPAAAQPPAANNPEPAGAPPEQPAEPAGAPTPPPPPAAPREAGGGGPPRAQQIASVRAACRSDFGMHCPGVRPGGEAALRCLQVNAPALSPPCRAAVEALGEAGAAGPPAAPGEAPAAVAPEAPAAAAPEAPAAASGRNVAPLGPLPPMMPRQAFQILSFCGRERMTLCGDVPPGGGRILECLAENAPRLSPPCYGAIARAIR